MNFFVPFLHFRLNIVECTINHKSLFILILIHPYSNIKQVTYAQTNKDKVQNSLKVHKEN